MHTIDPALAQWVRARIAEGRDRSVVIGLLREHGYDRPLAEWVTAQLFWEQARADAADDAHAGDPAAQRFEPAHPLRCDPHVHRIAADHGDIAVLSRCERPHVAALGNVLTAAECAALVAYARPRLQRGRVVNPQGGIGAIDPRRTSDEAFLKPGETPLVARIDARIRTLSGVPVSHGEGLLVMRYGVGGEYQPHYDYFDHERPGELAHLDIGQRMATLVIYLTDVPAGGETIFPRAGLSVAPIAGNAVYFAYTDAAGGTDPLSFHGGAPVLAGEKWIATKWLRSKPWTP